MMWKESEDLFIEFLGQCWGSITSVIVSFPSLINPRLLKIKLLEVERC